MESGDGSLKRGVRKSLVAHSERKLSTGVVMRQLGIEWKGDLVRTLNANRLPVPMGDVETKRETIDYVADLIGQEIERTGGKAFKI